MGFDITFHNKLLIFEYYLDNFCQIFKNVHTDAIDDKSRNINFFEAKKQTKRKDPSFKKQSFLAKYFYFYFYLFFNIRSDRWTRWMIKPTVDNNYFIAEK